MKIVTFDVKTMKDRLIGDENSLTITTAQGRFTIAEQDDGSLTIHESGHCHLAVLPRTGNAIALHAVTSPNSRTEPIE